MAKPLSMFISYSHRDEIFVDELKKHLITLKRRGILNDWHDRELVTGDSFDNELKEKLLNADFVAFLVSVDFLSSWYCYEVELKETLNRLDNGDVRIIPIIIRPCKWKDTELSNYLAATRDGKPICTYDVQDEAWVEVVDSIEKAISKYHSLKKSMRITNDAGSKNGSLMLNSEFICKLEDTEVVFNHKHKEKIILHDVFVSPDLKNIKNEYDEIGKTVEAMGLINKSLASSKVLILGGEQSGKTALSKMLFNAYFEQDSLPLLCSGKQITNVDCNKLFRKLLEEQYANLTADEYIVERHRSVLVIDDYSELVINIRHQKRLLDLLSEAVGTLIIISNTSIKYDESKFVELSDFAQYEILPFGNMRRGELIEKWNSIGRIETIDIKELHDENDRVTMYVNSIIRKNILPPKPVYILTIIQLIDTVKSSDYSLTSYGHCYQSLIQANFVKAKIKPRDFDLYINYLTELAYYLFDSGVDVISELDLEEFQKLYSKQYLVESHKKVIKELLISGVIRKKNEFIEFGYRYIYYFYVAKYLADHLDISNCKKCIEYLCENIHTEKNANILIFLVHHSKDSQIIDEILLHASVVFDGTEEATLDTSDTKYLMDYIASIPNLVIEQKDIDKERKSRLKEKDHMELEDGEISDEDNNNESDSKMLSEINRSARLIEIIGQILRNRYGSLKKDQLKDLSLSAYSSGLKFLNFFLTTTREDQEYILNFIKEIFRGKNKLTDEAVTKAARNIFLMFCYGTSYSVIKKIANSLGSDKLMPIFDDINNTYAESPAMKLIHIAIQLEFMKSIPRNELSEMYLDFEGNPIAQRLLQELVVQHLYLNHVDYKDRQWISSKMHLPLKTQRLLQSKGEYKT